MMIRSLSTGLRRTLGAPRLLLYSWIALVSIAAPAGLLMQRAIENDIGKSGVHADLRERLDTVWLSEFHSRSEGIPRTLEVPTVTKVDLLHNLDLLFNGALFRQQPGLVAAGVCFALVWLLILGGAIDRFARGPGRLVLAQFLGAAGRYYPRLLKLSLWSAIPFWLLYRAGSWGYGWIDEQTLDVTSETTILLYSAGAAVPLLLLAAAVMLIFDFAKVAAVLDEEPGRTAGHGPRRALRGASPPGDHRAGVGGRPLRPASDRSADLGGSGHGRVDGAGGSRGVGGRSAVRGSAPGSQAVAGRGADHVLSRGSLAPAGTTRQAGV